MNTVLNQFDWKCRKTWHISAKNTFWCLLGCTLGDYATILFFQLFFPHTAIWIVLPLATLFGLLTSISLETYILARQMSFRQAAQTALGMSIVSMIMMETAANGMELLLVGGAKLVWWAIIPSLLMGFLSAWPYNYYQLKKFGKSCH